jgi:ATP-binding protein involved in chromosome partitioning
MENIKEIISKIYDPKFKLNPFKKKNIQIIENNENIEITLNLGFAFSGHEDYLKKLITMHLPENNQRIDIVLIQDIQDHQTQGSTQTIQGIKNIIAISSGKGGVGKSTVTSNIASSLSILGSKVGILDADIYGPSQPTMFGKTNMRPDSADGKSMEPVLAHNIKLMSIGFLVDPDTAMIWRGPMVTNTLQQLLNETNWGELDYLLIDLPPGTGDTQLTLAQKIPVTAAITVTTPQDIALIDAQRSIKMFDKVNIPHLGVIENMSSYLCPNCGHIESIFGKNGGNELAQANHVDFLAALPLKMSIRENMDSGNPEVFANPASPEAKIFNELAFSISMKIDHLKTNYKNKFPEIKIEKT